MSSDWARQTCCKVSRVRIGCSWSSLPRAGWMRCKSSGQTNKPRCPINKLSVRQCRQARTPTPVQDHRATRSRLARLFCRPRRSCQTRQACQMPSKRLSRLVSSLQRRSMRMANSDRDNRKHLSGLVLNLSRVNSPPSRSSTCSGGNNSRCYSSSRTSSNNNSSSCSSNNSSSSKTWLSSSPM